MYICKTPTTRFVLLPPPASLLCLSAAPSPYVERYHWLPAHNPRIHSYCRRSEVRVTSARLIRRRTEYKHAWEVELRHSTYRECLIAGLPDRHIAKQTSVTEQGHKPYPDFSSLVRVCEHCCQFLSIPMLCLCSHTLPSCLPAMRQS
jgi:hypothetical protein